MQSLGYKTSRGALSPFIVRPRPTIILRSPETLHRLFLDDAHKGHTVAFFGDASKVVPYLPRRRIRDTLLFELSDTRPLGFNPLTDVKTAERVSDAIDVAWPTDIKTTQIDRYIIPACRALAETGGTLFQLPYLFTSERFRQAIISKLKTATIRYELEQFDDKKREKQDDQTNSVQNRFVVMKTDPAISAIISQHRYIENPGILIVDMPSSERFDFIAALILSTLTGVAYIERPLLHIGATTPVMSCDYLDQLPKTLREKMKNTATILATQLGVTDAKTLEDQFAVPTGNMNLLDISPGKALVRLDQTHQIDLYRHSYNARPSNLRRVRNNTATRYGAPKADIDAKIEQFIKGL